MVNQGTAYKAVMRLTITEIQEQDYGEYKCVAKNPRGETDGNIKLYGKCIPAQPQGHPNTLNACPHSLRSVAAPDHAAPAHDGTPATGGVHGAPAADVRACAADDHVQSLPERQE